MGEQQIISKSLTDSEWRLHHLYYIVDKAAQKVLFKPNVLQRRINDSNAKRKKILKSRQIGFSTNEIIKQFDYTCFTANVTSCILAHEQDAIRKLFRIASRAYEFMDPDVRPVIDRGGGSKYEMFFPEINSRIYCDLESRGDTNQWLHISEVAFCKDKSKIDSTLQTVPIKNGRVTFETTPNGMGNFFYDDWMSRDPAYEHFFFPWFEFPEYQIQSGPLTYTDDESALVKKHNLSVHQIAFRRFKQNELKGLFRQEYPEDEQSCFLTSGNAAMNLELVKGLLDNLSDPIQDRDGLKIFKVYNKTRRYVVGADTAEGIGKDFSVGTVFDYDSHEQVAILRGQFTPSEFAHKLKDLCGLYQHGNRPFPLLSVERNNHGHAVILELKEHIRYSNLYKYKDGREGWVSDRISRPLMVDTFIEVVENQTAKINDSDTLHECLSLIDKNGKIQAADSKHDDCIMASSIALQMCARNTNLDVYNDIASKIRMA